eukprot:40688_1
MGTLKTLLMDEYGDICGEIDGCCADGGTTNPKFRGCMMTAVEDDKIIISPDLLASLVDSAADQEDGNPIPGADQSATVQCMMSDSYMDFTECCSPDNAAAICNFLRSLTDIFSSEGYGRYDCGQTEEACDDMGTLKILLTHSFGDICGTIDGCCADGGTANPEFRGCMFTAIEDDKIIIPPDLVASLWPGGEDEAG